MKTQRRSFLQMVLGFLFGSSTPMGKEALPPLEMICTPTELTGRHYYDWSMEPVRYLEGIKKYLLLMGYTNLPESIMGDCYTTNPEYSHGELVCGTHNLVTCSHKDFTHEHLNSVRKFITGPFGYVEVIVKDKDGNYIYDEDIKSPWFGTCRTKRFYGHVRYFITKTETRVIRK